MAASCRQRIGCETLDNILHHESGTRQLPPVDLWYVPSFKNG